MSNKKPARLFLRKTAAGNLYWFILDEGKQTATGCPEADTKGADEALNRYLTTRPVKIEAGERDPAKVSVSSCLAYYGAEHAPTTAAPALIAIHIKHLLGFWSAKTLDDITRSTCRAYTAHRKRMTFQGRPIKATTAAKELGTLSAAIKYWNDEFRLINPPSIHKEEDAAPRERWLSRKEFARLLAAARRLGYPHLARFLLIGRYTGTRAEALLKLRWVRSLQNGYIDLEHGKMYRKGDGEKETKKRRPDCRIPAPLLAFMRRWAKADLAQGQTYVIHADGLPLKEMRSAWKGTKARTPWAKIAEAAGLTVDENGKRSCDVTPHVLRHTCITWRLGGLEGRKGQQSIPDVAAHVGASAKVILETYGHATTLVVEDRQRA